MINEHIHYHIKIKGHLDTSWQDWFDGLNITLTGDGHTIISGVILDQAALHGVLKKIRNLGLTLIPATLFVPGDVAATAKNIVANETLFRLRIMTALLTQVVQIFVVLFLYKVLKPAGKNLAKLMVIFILVAVPIAMLNELNQFAILILLNGTEYLTAFTAAQLEALLSLFLELRLHGIFIAQIFWGLWLFPMGYLVFKSGYLPRIIGVLLIVAGFGYLIDSIIFFLNPAFGIRLSEFLFLGELLMTFWLLIKGVNVEQWEKRNLESA